MTWEKQLEHEPPRGREPFLILHQTQQINSSKPRNYSFCKRGATVTGTRGSSGQSGVYGWQPMRKQSKLASTSLLQIYAEE